MTATRQTRCVIYVRISKDKIGAGLGVERQEKDCRALAERLGWPVMEVFSDNDMSAYSGKPRKQYLRMLEYLRAGHADAVLVWHTDRLHRSPAELEDYITLCQPHEIPTHCVQAGILDLSTASGRMQARISGAVARMEVEHMSERIRVQKVGAAAAGKWLGSPRPFGYTLLFDKPETPHRVVGVEVNEAEAEAIRDGVRQVLAGESVYAVTLHWRATVPPVRGGGWAQQNVKRTLCRAMNAGIAEHKGEIVGTSEWPRIISEDDYRAVVAILSDPGRSTYSGTRSLKWVGSGLYRCGTCGMDLRSASASDRGGLRRVYRCRSTRHVTVNAEVVDALVFEAAITILEKHGAGLIPDRDVERTRELHQRANTLQARLDGLGDDFMDGEITKAEFARMRKRALGNLADVVCELDRMRDGSALDGVADAADPGAALVAQSVARQRAVLDALLVVTVHPAKKGRRPQGSGFDFGRIDVRPQDADLAP